MGWPSLSAWEGDARASRFAQRAFRTLRGISSPILKTSGIAEMRRTAPKTMKSSPGAMMMARKAPLVAPIGGRSAAGGGDHRNNRDADRDLWIDIEGDG